LPETPPTVTETASRVKSTAAPPGGLIRSSMIYSGFTLISRLIRVKPE
jgi:hypothetical protein